MGDFSLYAQAGAGAHSPERRAHGSPNPGGALYSPPQAQLPKHVGKKSAAGHAMGPSFSREGRDRFASPLSSGGLTTALTWAHGLPAPTGATSPNMQPVGVLASGVTGTARPSMTPRLADENAATQVGNTEPEAPDHSGLANPPPPLPEHVTAMVASLESVGDSTV